MGDHLGRIIAVVDDVDLLAGELRHDLANALAHGPDAGALGIHARHRGLHCDLRAMARLARDRIDRDGAVGDLWYLEGEQLPDEVRVGA